MSNINIDPVLAESDRLLSELNVPRKTAFDLSELGEITRVEDEGVEIDILDHLDQPYEPGLRIRLAGRHSARYRRAENILRQRKLTKKSLTHGQAHEDTIFLAANCTIGWEGLYNAGAPVPFSVDAAKKVYEKASWILEQVVETINSHALFTTSSSSTQ